MADEIGNPNWTKSGMADDIVNRLRHAALGLPQDDMNQTAADEIERLRAEVERLSESLSNSMRLLLQKSVCK